MTKTIDAVFDGKVFCPDEEVELKPNTRVEIIIKTKPAAESKGKSFLAVARELRLEGPKDFSKRLDDYLYGGEDLDAK